MRDFALKLGESSEFISVTDEYNKPLRPDILGHCSIGDKSGIEIRKIELEKIPKINPETNKLEGYYLIFQVTPKLSYELGVGKFKYGIYIYVLDRDGNPSYFKEYETGTITIKDTFVRQEKSSLK
jgi:hypothetical protein